MTNPAKPVGSTPFASAFGTSKLIVGFASAVILVVCLGTIHASWLRKSHLEAAAATELERMGGSIHWAWRLDQRIQEKRIPSSPPPSWLIPGDSFVASVHLLDCHEQQLNEKLACIRDLRDLRCLALSNSRITDAALHHLADLPRLKWLDLHDTPITDAGLAYLPTSSHLERLNLCNTQITDASLPRLAEFGQLQWLSVCGTRVTPRGLALLAAERPDITIMSDAIPHSVVSLPHSGITRL